MSLITDSRVIRMIKPSSASLIEGWIGSFNSERGLVSSPIVSEQSGVS